MLILLQPLILRIARNFLIYLEALYLLRLNDVDKNIIIQFTHFRLNHKPYAPAFVTVRLAALTSFFNWTYEKGYSRENPLVSYKKLNLC